MKLSTLPVIECGIDRIHLYEDVVPKSSAYGLLSNTASINHEGIPVQEVLLKAGYKIVKIFSPEHGYHAIGMDGHSQPDDKLDSTSIPIISLYGNQLAPSPEHVRNLDAVIIDLPNVGVRFYTYLWTMVLMLEACAKASLPVIILDRPNPLGGQMDDTEGPMMSPEYFSFVGNWSIPVRFGLTLGELAHLIMREKKLNPCDLRVVRASGWTRAMNLLQYQYPFIPPSPAIREPSTIFTYPATCYLEATTISEGRGTPFPFQIAAAPWIDANVFRNFLEDLKLPGISFEIITVVPSENKFYGQACHGIKLMLIDARLYRPVVTGMVILASLQYLFPDHFRWTGYPTVVNPGGHHHFLKLTGDFALKTWFDQKPLDHLDDLDQLLNTEVWKDRCSSILLYE